MKRAKRAKITNKKNIAVIVFALLLVFLVSAGTIAWLTRTSTLSNTFSVGSIETPTTDPKDPTVTINIDGNLYEPSWNPQETHKLIPSVSFEKDPYVGIGAGSEDAEVYVYVENNFSNKVYFALNSGWEPVLGYVQAGSLSGTYTSGLFKYTSGLTASANADSWTTTPLFSTVDTADEANTSDFTPASGDNSEIVVKSFLHQAKDSEGTAINSDTIKAAAVEAFNLQ